MKINKCCNTCKYGQLYFYTIGDEPEYNGYQCNHKAHKYDRLDYDNIDFLYCKYYKKIDDK